jgi:hypothetical protein
MERPRRRTRIGLSLLGVLVIAGGIALGRVLPAPDGPSGRTTGQTSSTSPCPTTAGAIEQPVCDTG